MALKANTPVRLKRNPGRIGLITGKTREQNYFQIRFGNGLQWIPESEIELVEDEGDLFERFKRGKLGGPHDLKQVLHHARISGRLSDIFYSMEATNTDFHAFQYKPILKILDSPSNSLLIADEVGLGKTIEAGLIWTELRSRLDYRNLLVVCPATLREKWYRELQKRFGVEAMIVDARGLEKQLIQSKEKDFCLIASMQGLRSSKANIASQKLHETLDELIYEEPIIDLLIIDEAHYLKNPASKTHKMGKSLVNISNHRVFLSATPIHLGSDDLFYILNLLDETTFSNGDIFGDIFEDILNANAPLVKANDMIKKSPPDIRKVKKYLKKAEKHHLLKNNRQLKHVKKEVEINNGIPNTKQASHLSYKLNEINLLANIVTRTRKRDIQENRVIRDPRTEIIDMSSVEHLAYNAITELVQEYAKDKTVSEAFLMVMPQKRLSSCMPAAVHYWETNKDNMNNLNQEENSEWDFFEQNENMIGPLNYFLINNLYKIGQYNELKMNDSKYNRLSSILQKFKSEFSDEKIIIFSFFKATLTYLHQRLTEDGHSATLLMGGMGHKDDIIEKFESAADSSILLSSEIASEGVDLQFSRFLINYDLPWNPMKIEQRIGRIDRIGQKSDKITIWNLAYGNTIDELILERLYNRLDIFRYALGDIEDVLGKEIKQLTSELLSGLLSEKDRENRILQTESAIEIRKREEERLEEAASYLMAHGDYVIRKINNARKNDQWIHPRDIADYVINFLQRRYPNFEAIRLSGENESYVYEIKMPSDAKTDLEKFMKNRRFSSNSRLVNMDPEAIKCLFHNKIAIQVSGCEVINHLHPLVQWIGESINQYPFDLLHPLAMIRINFDVSLPKTVEPGMYGYAIQSWTIEGFREHNTLAYKILSIADGTFLQDDDAEWLIRSAIHNGYSSYTNISEKDLDKYEKCLFDAKKQLDQKFTQFHDHTYRSNQDFADLQQRNCEKYYRINSKRNTETIRAHKERLQNADPSDQGRFRGLIAATQKKIDKNKEQYDRKMYRINQNRELVSKNTDIAIGLIEVQKGDYVEK